MQGLGTVVGGIARSEAKMDLAAQAAGREVRVGLGNFMGGILYLEWPSART